jgi:hypothetical protein
MVYLHHSHSTAHPGGSFLFRKDSKKMSNFVPNSFQIPNAYVDKCLEFLTPEEWKVLTYLCRRIFGFQKEGHQDRVSISQFTNGITTREGARLDGGVGLSDDTVKNALKKLCEFGLVVRAAENDSRKNDGVLWRLQFDERKIDFQAMIDRKSAATEANKVKLAAVRGGGMAQVGVSHIPGVGVSHIPGVGVSHRPHNNQLQNQDQNTDSVAKATRAKPEKRGDILDGLLHFGKMQAEKQSTDAEGYPSEIKDLIAAFAAAWGLPIPGDRLNKAKWIRTAKDLLAAHPHLAGPRMGEIIQEARTAWGRGAGFTVSHPYAINSLIGAAVAAVAGRERETIQAELPPVARSGVQCPPELRRQAVRHG